MGSWWSQGAVMAREDMVMLEHCPLSTLSTLSQNSIPLDPHPSPGFRREAAQATRSAGERWSPRVPLALYLHHQAKDGRWPYPAVEPSSVVADKEPTRRVARLDQV